MNIKEAILSFSQSEKVKSGILWILQSVELLPALQNPERQGAERIIKATIQMLGQEVYIAGKLTKDSVWSDVEHALDLAFVMINSGVSQESSFHLTRALHHVTGICKQSMLFLKDNGFL